MKLPWPFRSRGGSDGAAQSLVGSGEQHEANFGFWTAVAFTVNYIMGCGFLGMPHAFVGSVSLMKRTRAGEVHFHTPHCSHQCCCCCSLAGCHPWAYCRIFLRLHYEYDQRFYVGDHGACGGIGTSGGDM